MRYPITMDGVRECNLVGIALRRDLRTTGVIPEAGLRLTWLRLDKLQRVTRCNVFFGI